MEKFFKLMIMLIVIDMGFKADMVEGGSGILNSNEKVVNQPQNFPGWPPGMFPGFPNWDFTGKQNPGHGDNNPGFPRIPIFPGFSGFPLPGPGDGDSPPLPPGFSIPLPLLPIFPFLPYFKYGPPRYCILFIGCIPIPKFLIPPVQGQSPQATPLLSPPDQTPLNPRVQPSPTNPTSFQPPPVPTRFQPPPVSLRGQLPTIPTPPIQSSSAQAEALIPPSPNA